MNKISEETLKNSYKPFDIVEDEDGNVGIVKEVNINTSQPNPMNQVTYSVRWIVCHTDPKCAWWEHSELSKHGNLFIVIAEMVTHPFGQNEEWAEELFKHF